MKKHILDVTRNLHKRNTNSLAFKAMVMRKVDKYELIDSIVTYICRKLWSRKDFRTSLEGFLVRLLFVSKEAVENNTYINKANAFIRSVENINVDYDLHYVEKVGIKLAKFLLSLSVVQLEEMVRKQSKLNNAQGVISSPKNRQLCKILHKHITTELYT